LEFFFLAVGPMENWNSLPDLLLLLIVVDGG